MLKLPFAFFRDFRPHGPLHLILRRALEFQKDKGWQTFEILSLDRKQDAVQFLKRVESVLLEVGALVQQGGGAAQRLHPMEPFNPSTLQPAYVFA